MIATAEPAPEARDGVMLLERITLQDLESEHFTRQLVERLRWAVRDSHEAETTR